MSPAPVGLCLLGTLISTNGAENDMATTVQLSPEIEKRLDLLVSETGLTKSSILQEIIERGLDDVEDYYLAAQVLERIRSGQERVFSSDEVRRDLGLDG